MRKDIKEDLYRYIGSDCNRLIMQLRYFFFTPGFRYIYYLRHAASSKYFKLFWWFLLRQCMYRTGIQIPYQTKIGRGFRIVHFGAIVVNPSAIIGDNFNIAEGALIGNTQGKKQGVPVIGNNVCVNANAIVVGGIHIGNNVLIAPGAFVNFDVPDNSIVIGNPGKIIQRNSSPTAKFIVYPLP